MLTGLVAPHAFPVAITGGFLAAAGLVASDLGWSLGLMVTGGSFVVIAALALVHRRLGRTHVDARLDALAGLFEHDETPHLQTDVNGIVTYQNAAASSRFSDCIGRTMAQSLEGFFANPGAVLFRLQNRATTHWVCARRNCDPAHPYAAFGSPIERRGVPVAV